MKIFEYGELIIERRYGIDVCIFEGETLNSEHSWGYNEMSLIEALNTLGQDSWELVMKNDDQFILKREVTVQY